MIDSHLNAVFENVNEIDKNRKIAERISTFLFSFFLLDITLIGFLKVFLKYHPFTYYNN